MCIKVHFLDNISIKSRYIQTDYINHIDSYQPNNVIYFFGLLIALLIQVLVISDCFLNYKQLSFYLSRSKWKDIRYLISKYDLNTNRSLGVSIYEYYWLVVFIFISMELLFCLIAFFFYSKTLLYLSIIIWMIPLSWSIFALLIVRYYHKTTDRLKQMEMLRDQKIRALELFIKRTTPFWRAEEILKHGAEYTEIILETKITDYRNSRMRVINELIQLEDSFIIEVMKNENEFKSQSTYLEVIQKPTHYNFLNVIFFMCYVSRCSEDSQFIYDLLYNLGLIRQRKGYTPIFKFFDYDTLLGTLDPEVINIFLFGCNYMTNL